MASSDECPSGDTADTDMSDIAISSNIDSDRAAKANEIIKFTNKDIRNAIEELGSADDISTRVKLFERINAWVTSDGQTLFEYHADALLSEGPRLSVNLSGLWAQRNEEEKSFWAASTGKLKNGLNHGTPTCLRHFQLGTYSKQTIAYSGRIKAALYGDAQKSKDTNSLDEVGKALDNLDLSSLSKAAPVMTTKFQQSDVAPKTKSVPGLTEMFYGGPLPDHFEVAIPGVLRGVQSYINKDTDSKLRLRGRLDGIRIDYHATKFGIPFLADRLDISRSRGGFVSNLKYDDTDPYDTCEYLLRPLVYWNRKVFSHVPGLGLQGKPSKDLIPERESRAYVVFDDHTRLEWLAERDDLPEMFPGDWTERSEEVVEYIMDKFHSYMIQLDGNIELPQLVRQAVARIVGDFEPSPAGDVQNLTTRLRGCFKRKGLRPEQYMEFIEQQFYWLHRKTSINGKQHRDPLMLAPEGTSYVEAEKQQKQQQNAEKNGTNRRKGAADKTSKQVNDKMKI